jgi:hypothetical protein
MDTNEAKEALKGIKDWFMEHYYTLEFMDLKINHSNYQSMLKIGPFYRQIVLIHYRWPIKRIPFVFNVPFTIGTIIHNAF